MNGNHPQNHHHQHHHQRLTASASSFIFIISLSADNQLLGLTSRTELESTGYHVIISQIHQAKYDDNNSNKER